MNNRHLEYQLKIPISVCTDKTKEELIRFLKSELDHIEGIYTLVGDFEFKNVTLCDCDAFECNEEKYNE